MAGTGPGEPRLVLYGDFNCAWSYLASRRAARLAADGVHVDWRAVEHDPPHRRQAKDVTSEPVRLGGLIEEVRRVLAFLLPGERLPYALAGFVPDTGAAVAGYAEAYLAGTATAVRELLFEALWLHAFDLDDPSVVHTLIVDAVRSGTATTEPLSGWEYDGDRTLAGTSEAGMLAQEWAEEWHGAGDGTVPILLVDGQQLRGVEAVTWLGTELVGRGLVSGVREDPGVTARPAHP